MADEVNFTAQWADEATQCKNCKQFHSQEGKNACVPSEMSFDEALAAYGEVSPEGHCDLFESR